jgi:nucleotide-binding universal stress UspA family protein
MARAIVVGYDDSSGSRQALAVAADLAVREGDDLVIAYGYAPPGGPGEEASEHREALEELGRRVTASAVGQVKAGGVNAEVALVNRRPVDALLTLAEERDARFIVVGGYGESPIKGAILGSTPHKLLHLSQVPVVVVPCTG